MTFVQDERELRALYGIRSPMVARKVLDHLDSHCRDFIAASPFLVIATRGSSGDCDASPRGDDPGFVEVIDDTHMLLIDKPGNNRLDSLVNILNTGSIGMLFFIPAIHETLRVNGLARITCDPGLLRHAEYAAREEAAPKTGLLIEVHEAFLHCSRSLQKAKIWEPDSWPKLRAVAAPARIWKDHVGLNTGQDNDKS